jgi:hypothetical protein
MSSVAISGNASGAGVLTIAAPNTASNFTLTLPTNTGTLISTASTGQVIPKAALPTGSVLQVVQANYSTEVSSSSASYVTTNLVGTITPTSSTSRVLVITSMQISRAAGTSNNSGMNLQLQRNATAIQTSQSLLYTNTNLALRSIYAYSYLDSPATTSATTYTWYMAQQNAGDVIYTHTNNTTSTIILMEIAA